MDEDGYNQVEVLLPELPHYLPRSLRSEPVAHLFLKFHPSVMSLVEKCIQGNGYSKYLVSVIIMEAEVASACAVLVPECIKSEAYKNLNGAHLREDFKLEVLPFKHGKLPNPSFDSTAHKSASGIFELSISPQLPGYIIKRHIEEHFQRLKPAKIDLSADHCWKISFSSLSSAKEAVATFNNSLLMDKIIQVSFYEQPGLLDRANAFTSEAHKLSDESTSYSFHGAQGVNEAEAFHPIPTPQGETCNIFVYSTPKFHDFVGRKELMKHFCKFNPVNAYVIKKHGLSTGTAKVSFPSKFVAEMAMEAMKRTKVLDSYTISLKFEDPSHPPKSKSHHVYKDGEKQSPDLSLHASPQSQTESLQVWSGPTLSQAEKGQYNTWEDDKSIRRPPQKPRKEKSCHAQHIPWVGGSKQSPDEYESPAFSQTQEKQSTSHKFSTLSIKSETVSSCSLKVSHISYDVTIAKLIGLFERFGKLDGDPVIHEGCTPYAHVNFRTSKAAEDALHGLNNTKFEGSQITIKSVKSLRRMSKGIPSPELRSQGTTTQDLELLPEQWNRLMVIGPKKTTLLEDLIASYNDNPNVTVQPAFDKKVIQFTGEEKTVQSARKYLAAQLKKELEIGR